jgi:predicted metal-binding membrane protein
MWPRAMLTVALRGPGKALLFASAAGWIAIAWLLTNDPLPHSMVAPGHGAHAVASIATPISHLPPQFTALWLAMILAMAPPLLVREVGCLWRAGLRRLRPATIAWFVCGYVGIWLFVGVVLVTIIESAAVSAERIAVAVALVAIYLCSPARQRCLNACHRLPTLRVFGAAAQWDSLRYGVSTGCYCAAACGPLMLLVLLVKDHHLAAMAVAAVLTTLERHLPARRPRWRLPILPNRSPEWADMSAAIRSAGA